MGLLPCVPCASRLFSFWNTAGYLRSLPAVAVGQGLVQLCGCEQSAITPTMVMLWSHRFMCKTESELPLLTPPIRPPASSSAAAQSENGVSGKVKNLTKSHKVSFLLSRAWWDKKENRKRIPSPDWGHKMAVHVTVHAGKPPLQLAVSRRLSVAMVLDSGNTYSPQRRGTGVPNKRRNLDYVQVTCNSRRLILDILSHPFRSWLTHIINNLWWLRKVLFVVKEIRGAFRTCSGKPAPNGFIKKQRWAVVALPFKLPINTWQLNTSR